MPQLEDRTLPYTQITICPDLQLRFDATEHTELTLREETVLEYVEMYRRKEPVDRLEVVEEHDRTGTATGRFLLAHGFHRWEALRRLGRTMLPVTVRQGTYDDAIFLVCKLDAYGPRYNTLIERERVIRRCLEVDIQGGYSFSDETISRATGYDVALVKKVRAEMEGKTTDTTTTTESTDIPRKYDPTLSASSVLDRFTEAGFADLPDAGVRPVNRGRRSSQGRTKKRTHSSSRSTSVYRTTSLWDTSDNELVAVIVTWVVRDVDGSFHTESTSSERLHETPLNVRAKLHKGLQEE